MKTVKLILALALTVTWSAPLAAQEVDMGAADDSPATSTFGEDTTESIPAGTEQTLELVFRLETALGANICVNGSDRKCSGYPTFTESQDAGAYGRLGATVFLPDPVSFLSAGLVMDVGGHSLISPSDPDATSVTFHLLAMLRAAIPTNIPGWEVTTGIGLGIANWESNDFESWTGLTIPLTAGIGYEVVEKLYVGGELFFVPRISTDSAPHNFQFGVYASYWLPVTFTHSAE